MSSLTPFAQSFSSMASSPGHPRASEARHGFSCFSPWMPHQVRHDISFPVIPGLDPGIHLLLKVFMDAASSAA
ncbi:hypothetical protein [Prosthecochloris sp. SCSIO W1103]|uniref:hypothetical protein n=1 Tax=Prosthecochloris sp. SCSIO W1103 TaxID=2992244 RepID=UPI00223E01B3|nr:hypothetical protein [Prosthecochloris sp. SCSIO W1103]UZJ37105.1 hypothetical protein OO005_10150 [Prosthecochloris sp. SCSIO W1103]